MMIPIAMKVMRHVETRMTVTYVLYTITLDMAKMNTRILVMAQKLVAMVVPLIDTFS